MSNDNLSMLDLVHGTHYLVDFYQMFGLTREQVKEGPDAVKKKYHQLTAKFHTDKYAHLPEVFRQQAEHVFLNVQLGYATFIDPIKLEAYDRQLAEWKGPISWSGFPTYDPQFYAELHRTPLTDDQIDQAEEIIGQITGYDADTHSVLQRQLNKGSTDPGVLRAMDHSLFGKEVLRSVQEHLFWRNAGVSKYLPEGNTPAGYLEQVRSELAAAREQIPQRAQMLLLQAGSGQVRLLTRGGEDQTEQLLANPEQSLVGITASLTRRFDEVAPRIGALAAEQELIRERRLELLDGEYRPRQRKLHPKLILCLEVGQIKRWMAFKMLGLDSCTPDESIAEDELKSLDDRNIAKSWIRRGYNVMFLKVRDGMDPLDQMQEVVAKHYDRYRARHRDE